MIDPRNVDLHMHSVVSDGTDAPPEILTRVKAAGITLFSLTDHDAVGGCDVIRDLLREGDPNFVYGVEFSCADEGGKYHILGYGYDDRASAVRELVDTCHAYRMEKVKRRLDFLASEYGFTFTEEERELLFSLPNPGKPHIANLMIKHGYAPTIREAFRNYLNMQRGVGKRIRPEDAIRAVTAAGGIPVLAHPSYGSGDELIIGEEMERRLEHLIGYGIRGVEAFYSGFSKTLQEEMLSFAERYDLYVTAGSDYHGSNKLVRLGDTNLTEAEACPKGLVEFIRDVKKY